MKYITGTDFKLKHTAVTLGKFDGIHLGHQLLLNHILAQKNLDSVMFTFSLHPGNLFSDQDMKLIMTEQERIHYLEMLGLSCLIAYPFTKETAAMEPQDFVSQILVEQMDAKLVVVGEDFRFGHRRGGDVDLLRALAKQYGYEVVAYPKVRAEGDIVGSSRIRALIEQGNMESVTALLGRPYAIEGTVVHGNQLGRTVGMPTANIRPEDDKLLPPNGVYVADFTVDGETYRGITNIGYKPTIGGETKPGAETWIFDFNRDIYGKAVKVELLQFVRAERVFQSLEEVKEQVERDAMQARCFQ